MTLAKGPHGVAVNDVVLPAIVSKDVYPKYQYKITNDKFNNIGGELEAEGYFRRNKDGLLALTTAGLDHIEANIQTI